MEVSLYFPSILLSENKPRTVRFKILTSSYLLHITVPSLKRYAGRRAERRETAQLGKDHEAFRGQERSERKQNLTAALRSSSGPFSHDTVLCALGTRTLACCRMGAQVRKVFLSKKNLQPLPYCCPCPSGENNLFYG